MSRINPCHRVEGGSKTPVVRSNHLVCWTLLASVMTVGRLDGKQGGDIQLYHVHPLVEPSLRAALWNRARSLMGLPVTSNSTFETNAQERAAERFYLNCGLPAYLFLDGSALFVRIPKSANDATRCNLEKFPGDGWIVPCPVPAVSDAYRENNTKVFTVVREPLSRFVSGYTEVEYRNSEDQQIQRKFRHEHGTKMRVKEYIVQILDGVEYLEIFHTFSQSWIGRSFPDIFAMKVEKYSAGWKQLHHFLGVNEHVEFDSQCGTHESSLDPLKTKLAAIKLLREDMNVVKTLCTMFLPDFLNYRFPLPKICRVDDDISMLAKRLSSRRVAPRSTERRLSG